MASCCIAARAWHKEFHDLALAMPPDATLLSAAPPTTYPRGGTVYDGTGSRARADVGIRGDRIAPSAT